MCIRDRQSPEWMQIITDILGTPLSVSNEGEASCLGAAIMAIKAMGMIKDYSIPEYNYARHSVFKPSKQNHEIYMKAYKKFKICRQHGGIINGMD